MSAKTLKVVDMFSGTGGFSAAFRKSLHWEVFEIDLNPENHDEIQPDMEADILDLEAMDLSEEFRSPDVILASPPCKAFSLAAAHHHMDKEVNPQSEFGAKSINMVKATIELIEELSPKFSFIENPRSGTRRVMRKTDWGLGEPTGTVSWCQYGANRMKPTDLWGNHPESLEYRFCGNGNPCHESATRGSRTGTQGISSSIKRAAIPFGMSLAILEACEREIDMSNIEELSYDTSDKSGGKTTKKKPKETPEGYCDNPSFDIDGICENCGNSFKDL